MSDSACRSVEPAGTIVRWTIAAEDESDRLAWCQSVGPVVVISPAQQPPRRDPSPASLRAATRPPLLAVVSWNTHVGAGNLPALVASLATGALTGGQPPTEILMLLQEVLRRSPAIPPAVPGMPIPRAIRPTGTAAGEVAAWARELGMHLAYVPSMRNGSGDEDRGSAILSTIPLHDIEAIELPFVRQRRVAVAASVEASSADGGRLGIRLATAHFDTGLALTGGGPARLRLRAAHALLNAVAVADGAVIVGGDLNASWAEDEPAVKLLSRGLPDGRRADRADTWHGPWASRGRLDYLFARLTERTLVVSRVNDRFGSDHYPLVGWLVANHDSD